MTAVNKSSAIGIGFLAALFALMLTLAGCGGGQASSSDSAQSSPASVGQAKLAIIHTNDTHGYDQATDTSLGMAAVAQLKADYEAQGYDVLLLDAGDAIQGALLANDSKGADVIDFMNACGYDAMALGNHEFDYGADVLQERMAACNFPVLCANITIDATGEPFTQANIVSTLSDGTKVGVFGIDTPETMTKSDPRNTAGLSITSADDLYACTQAQVDELHAQGCDLIVCLGHLGEEDASAPNRASDVVAATEGIDLLIDGHDHEVENQTIQDKAGNDVLVVETGCYLAGIGVATYENGVLAETLVEVGKYDGKDADLAAKIDAVESEIDARMSKVVGTTSFLLNGERFPGVRDRETNLGDFVADAVRWEAKQAQGVEPDCVIMNGGGIRCSIDVGDITQKILYNTYPYSNQICAIEVTGAQLLEALEAACQNCPDQMGSFPQVSGITFTLDTTVPYEKGDLYPCSTYCKPANPGSRITITDVNGRGFDLEPPTLLP